MTQHRTLPGKRRVLQALAAWGLSGGWRPLAAQPNAIDAAAPSDADAEMGPGAAADAISPQHALRFPRDHGAHPGSRIEWWYATGWLQPGRGGDGVASSSGGSGSGGSSTAGGIPPLLGFQLTFFRSHTGLATDDGGRFAPRQLLFAHAAITDVRATRHRHARRMARWNGEEREAGPVASTADTLVRVGAWRLVRRAINNNAAFYLARLAAPEAGFTLDLQLGLTQPLLLQGAQGYSTKGPPAADGAAQPASHYYSQPQLRVTGSVEWDGRSLPVSGRAWLDHEWSDALMPPNAQGWDWLGINLQDGSALTVFVLRDAKLQPVWAGGSLRRPGAQPQAFTPEQVRLTPLNHWTSPATGARYPVRWRVQTPAGTHELRALLDTQELDDRLATGTVYWEGLSELLDTSGARVGLGYLEMTGYQGRLRLP